MEVELAQAPGVDPGIDVPSADRSGRAALLVFVAVEAAALALILVLARDRWFYRDDWDFLAARTGGDLGDLFRPHNSHWTTLPILAYRALWWVFGLHSYLPYQALVVVAHLASAALLRIVIRRAGVSPWIATAAASLFALFGAGYQDIVSAFQIAFTGGLALGLGYLVLADHDGRIDRRDWLGLFAGLGALMCSGVGLAMVVSVAVSILIRRGWRIAAVHASALGTVYGAWWIVIGRGGRAEEPLSFDPTLGEVARFTLTGVQAAFGNLAQLPGVGLLLGALFVLGLILAWARLDLRTLRTRAAAPAALVIGALVFAIGTGTSRAGFFGPDYARESRYQHVIAGLLLPALAVALDAIGRRWRPLVPVFCALLLLGIPGNIGVLSDRTEDQADAYRRYRHLILAIPRTKTAHAVPREVRPDTANASTRHITVGWLLDAAASGQLPQPNAITRADEIAIRFRLSLAQSDVRRQSEANCEAMRKPVVRHLGEGDTITFAGGPLRITPRSGTVSNRAQAASAPSVFRVEDGRRLIAVVGPIDVVLSGANFFLPVRLCDDGPR